MVLHGILLGLIAWVLWGCAASSAAPHPPMLCRMGRIETGEAVLYCRPVTPLREVAPKPEGDDA